MFAGCFTPMNLSFLLILRMAGRESQLIQPIHAGKFEFSVWLNKFNNYSHGNEPTYYRYKLPKTNALGGQRFQHYQVL
jgi:hypothetical protein